FREGPDLRISNDDDTLKYRIESQHHKLVGSDNSDSHEFAITDYEVFQVVSIISIH
ncbi:13407_t:CDS:1, partial [Racocetra fulgida]